MAPPLQCKSARSTREPRCDGGRRPAAGPRGRPTHNRRQAADKPVSVRKSQASSPLMASSVTSAGGYVATTSGSSA